jgi:hypothetical protein
MWCLKSSVNAGMPGKVNPASQFLPLVNSVTPSSAFRHQGQSGTAGHELVRHCPAMLFYAQFHGTTVIYTYRLDEGVDGSGMVTMVLLLIGATGWRFCRKTQKEPPNCLCSAGSDTLTFGFLILTFPKSICIVRWLPMQTLQQFRAQS